MGNVAVNRPASLQEQVEAIAMESVVFHADADPVESLMPQLDLLRAEAEMAARQDVASIAAELIEGIAKGQSAASAEEQLHAGIERLRGILANPGAPPPEEPRTISFAQDPELVSEFLVETREHMANVEKQLLVLEQNSADTEAVHAVFRAFHSTKGVAGFLELRNVGEFCQEVETVLDRVRTGAMTATPEVVDLILEATDWVRQAATQIEQSQPDGRAAPELLARIRSLAGRGQLAIALPAPPEAFAPPPDASAPPRVTPANSPRAVKIDTAKLDYLVEMAGELVIAHSMVQHNPALTEIAEPGLLQGLAQLSRVTTEVQRTVMGMRMVPISTLFDRMERLVRELTRKSGKKAELQVTGGETELDRNIVEESVRASRAHDPQRSQPWHRIPRGARSLRQKPHRTRRVVGVASRRSDPGGNLR